MSLKHTLAAAGLLLLPIMVVLAVRKSHYGPVLTTPAYRQQGASKAKVAIVEYSDFQCPSCARIQPILKELLKTYDGKVRLYFKHYPLTHMHVHALPAAIATECAGRQNKFWPYSETLYARQNEWAPLADATTHYVALAAELTMNLDTFDACRNAPETRATVLLDSDEAKARGVNATPTFFVGDQRMVGGVFASDGAQAIERALRQ